MNDRLKSLVLGLFAVGLVACSPDYQTVRLSAVSNPPAAVEIRGNRMDIPAGIAVVIRAELVSSTNEEYPGNGELELYTSDASIFDVYPRPGNEEFVVIGIAPGTACMDVVVDGPLEDCVEVTVGAAPL